MTQCPTFPTRVAYVIILLFAVGLSRKLDSQKLLILLQVNLFFSSTLQIKYRKNYEKSKDKFTSIVDTPEHLRTTKVNKQISDVSTRNTEWILKVREHLQIWTEIFDCQKVWKILPLFSGRETGMLNVLVCLQLFFCNKELFQLNWQTHHFRGNGPLAESMKLPIEFIELPFLCVH